MGLDWLLVVGALLPAQQYRIHQCVQAAVLCLHPTDEDFVSVGEREEIGLGRGSAEAAIPFPSQYQSRGHSACSQVFPVSTWWRKSLKGSGNLPVSMAPSCEPTFALSNSLQVSHRIFLLADTAWVVSHISKCSGLVSSRRCLSRFIFQVNWLPCDFVGFIEVANLLFLQLFPCCKRGGNVPSSCLPSVALSSNTAMNSTLPSWVPLLIAFELHNWPG